MTDRVLENVWNIALAAVVLLTGACESAPTDNAPHEIAVIVKVDGIPWFDRLETGVVAATHDLGVVATMTGPVGTDDPIQTQIELVEDAIERDVDAIAVVPNDAAALEAVLGRARAAGILVLTHESPDQANADWDIETIDSRRFAEAAMQRLGDAMGGSGQVGQFVGGADLHDYWQQVAETYAATTWGGAITFVSIEDDGTSATVCGEDSCAGGTCACRTATETLLDTYPDLGGILAFGSQGPIGAGLALQAMERTDVAVVGAAIPSQAAPLLEAEYITSAFLWDPRDAGYALVAVAEQILDGTNPASGLTVSGLGAASVDADSRDIYFDRTLEITADNAESLGF